MPSADGLFDGQRAALEREIARIAAGAGGPVGVVARHLETGFTALG